ncbi:OmpA family protein [Streptomyces sp. NBC_01775]|uniref:OmpA family protein n=1 Tax=Streptomyces sp. NBC_01775 TaxID=2975939 RepID=UPI002DDA7C24|nr:OmpA family protein [Streptomyces sp. NBC_01775]WSB81555.1 OmpA family protein [Streptomyces sp. NBC_01775]
MVFTRPGLTRVVACSSFSAALVLGMSVSVAQAKSPAPRPSPSVPDIATKYPTDNPTTIPTGQAPSLPGETGPGDKGFSEPPDNMSDSKPSQKLDPQAKGLRLAGGAKLADPKVLDIKFVTEDLGGEERREDSKERTKFTLQAEVLFPKDRSTLNSGAKARIKTIADEIEKQKSTEVNVFGFTDDLGSYDHGKTLSKKRATQVQTELSRQLGSDVSFNVRGYSEDYPVADNGTEEGRTKNRRVEVSFPRED